MPTEPCRARDEPWRGCSRPTEATLTQRSPARGFHPTACSLPYWGVSSVPTRRPWGAENTGPLPCLPAGWLQRAYPHPRERAQPNAPWVCDHVGPGRMRNLSSGFFVILCPEGAGGSQGNPVSSLTAFLGPGTLQTLFYTLRAFRSLGTISNCSLHHPTDTHAHRHANTQTCKHTCVHTLTRMHTHANTHTRAHTRRLTWGC